MWYGTVTWDGVMPVLEYEYCGDGKGGKERGELEE